jgi:integrase
VSPCTSTPALVGNYFDNHSGSPATRKLHLAALRCLFDLFVTRHLMVLNAAACVRGERYQVIEGKTPEITRQQAMDLLVSIDTATVVGLRDLAAIGVMIFTAARAGAIARLRLKHFSHDGSQWTLRFEEKGGKSRKIPVAANRPLVKRSISSHQARIQALRSGKVHAVLQRVLDLNRKDDRGHPRGVSSPTLPRLASWFRRS